jgi:hypothetical protein
MATERKARVILQVCTLLEDLKRVLYRLHRAGPAQLQTILATLAAGFIQITHDMQGQNSRAPMLSLWLLGVTLS